MLLRIKLYSALELSLLEGIRDTYRGSDRFEGCLVVNHELAIDRHNTVSNTEGLRRVSQRKDDLGADALD